MPRTAHATTKRKHGNDARAQAWRSIRMLRQFSIGDLRVTGAIGYDNARRYLQRLELCGVIRLIATNRSGCAGSVKRWRLVRDLGPRAPIAQLAGGLYNPNSGEILGDAQDERQKLASSAH